MTYPSDSPTPATNSPPTVVPRAYEYGRRARRATRRRTSTLQTALFKHSDEQRSAADLTAEAEFAEAEFDTTERIVDPEGARRGSLPLAIGLAALFAFADFLPSWWASEAMGDSLLQTAALATLFTAALAGFGWMLSLFRHQHSERNFVLALLGTGALVAVETYLRFDYLRVVSDMNLGRAGIRAVVLALVTVCLVALSYLVLVRARPVELQLQKQEKDDLVDQALRARRAEQTAFSTLRNEASAFETVKGARRFSLDELEAIGQAGLDAAQQQIGQHRPVELPPASDETGESATRMLETESVRAEEPS